ncbi:MAG: tannase/feruloyl esterase family alpha/beta hydrolase [Qingshengfaniella sp.]
MIPCEDLASTAAAGPHITSARLVPMPRNCEVTAEIPPADPDGFPIQFKVNMPLDWNRKAVHGGGSGLNGVVAPLVKGPLWEPETSPAPLFQGYATYTSDSGHDIRQFDHPAEFALNAESLENFAGAQIGKVKSAATDIITAFYGQAPERTYFIGYSQGGREALVAAQRYPDAYDGIISGDPVVELASLWISHIGAARSFLENDRAGMITPAQQAALGQLVLAQCDPLDGIKDGRIANDYACSPDLSALSCTAGQTSVETCLSDAQIAAVIKLKSPVAMDFPLAGKTQIAAKPWGDELIGGGAYFRAVNIGPGGDLPGIYKRMAGIIASFIAQDPGFDFANWDWNAAHTRARLQEVAALVGSNNPDLGAFRKTGGKLIVYGAGASNVSPGTMAGYYQDMVAEMGQATVDDFIRFYMFPNTTHDGATLPGTPRSAELLAALEAWVELGMAPGDLVNGPRPGEEASDTPTWPLCRYPTYPRYIGKGDPAVLDSYVCAAN